MAYLIGPSFLGLLIPRYAEGLPALRPLLPGTLLLGLAWPARQMLIAVGRPYALAGGDPGGPGRRRPGPGWSGPTGAGSSAWPGG